MKTLIVTSMFALFAATAFAAADGKAIYVDKCQKCHAANGEGDPKACEKLCPDVKPEKLSLKDSAKKADAELRKQIVEGTDDMPAYKDKLSAEEIDAVLAYCRVLVPAKK